MDKARVRNGLIAQCLGPRELWILLLLVGLILFLALYNLETYPSVWFDEGIHLQVPKNLVLSGQYAVRENGELRSFDPSVSTGPPLLLPVALVFRLLGIGLWQARLVTVIYLLLATAAFYGLARHLFGLKVALLALVMVIASPGAEFISLGRQVMGELPALFFFLMGTLLWLRATQRSRRSLLLLVGLAFGLAMITKNIYAVILPVALILLHLLDQWYYRQLDWSYFWLPLIIGGGCLAAWYGYQSVSLGFGTFQGGARVVGASSARSIFVFSSQRMLSSLKFVIGPNFYVGWGVPGLLYGLYLARRRDLIGLHQAFVGVISAIWLTWYVLASIGWPRYAFPAIVIVAISSARLLFDLLGWLQWLLRSRISGEWGKYLSLLTRGIYVILTGALLVVVPIYKETLAMLSGDDRSPQLLAAYLDARVPQHELIESWEWEIDFFTNHRYHHPPMSALDAMVRHEFLDEPYSTDAYDVLASHPEYLIVGKFAKWTGIYPAQFLDEKCTLIVSIGEYDLYRIDGGHG